MARGKLKDGVARSDLYSMRMPADLRTFIAEEAARRVLQGRKGTSAADIVVEALRTMRFRLQIKRARI